MPGAIERALQAALTDRFHFGQILVQKTNARFVLSHRDDLVANVCRSNGGCLRTILWERDARGTVSSTKLPSEKFDPGFDQAAARAPSSACAEATADKTTAATVPLFCQEACSLLIAE